LASSAVESNEATVLQLLDDLNLDDLLAGLEEDSPEQDAPAPQATSTRRLSANEDDDRRAARRLTPSELTTEVRLTIPGASQTALVNVSETGVLLETTRRLCPGKAADLFVRLNGQRQRMRATVVRSTLYSIKPTPIYRAALRFDTVLALQSRG
jgi:hypothetical protein